MNHSAKSDWISKNRLFIVFLTVLLYAVATVGYSQKITTITGVNVLTPTVGTTVTVTGTNFTTASQIYMGSIPVKTIFNTTSSLSFNAPKGASYDRVSVITPGVANTQSDLFLSTYDPAANKCSFTNAVFDTAQFFNTGISSPVKILLEDITRDGRQDLLVLGSDRTLTVYSNSHDPKNPKTVSFTKLSTTSLLTKAAPSDFIVEDLNCDGFMDVVVGYSSGTKISILKGSANGTFTESVIDVINNSPQVVAAGDLDNDGKLEIVLGHHATQPLITFVNNTSAVTAFDFAKYAVVEKITIPNPATSIVIGDISSTPDKLKDIIFTDGSSGFYCANSNIFGNFTFGPPQVINAPNANIVTIGDFDNTTGPDVVFGITGGIVLSTSTPKASKKGLYTNNAYAMTGADYTGDGYPDLAVLNSNPKNSNVITFYNNDKSGTLTTPIDSINTGISGQANLVTGDIDRDGQADLVTYDQNGTIYFYLKSTNVFITKAKGASVCPNTDAVVSAETNVGKIT